MNEFGTGAGGDTSRGARADRVIDATGMYLLPGFVDMHVHAGGSPKNAEADYLSGVVNQRWQKPEVALEFYSAAADKETGELAFATGREVRMLLGSPSRIREKLDELYRPERAIELRGLREQS